MFCVKCGKEISEGTRFCPYCGNQVASGGNTPAAPEEKSGDVGYKPVTITQLKLIGAGAGLICIGGLSILAVLMPTIWVYITLDVNKMYSDMMIGIIASIVIIIGGMSGALKKMRKDDFCSTPQFGFAKTLGINGVSILSIFAVFIVIRIAMGNRNYSDGTVVFFCVIMMISALAVCILIAKCIRDKNDIDRKMILTTIVYGALEQAFNMIFLGIFVLTVLMWDRTGTELFSGIALMLLVVMELYPVFRAISSGRALKHKWNVK